MNENQALNSVINDYKNTVKKKHNYWPDVGNCVLWFFALWGVVSILQDLTIKLS